LLLLFFRVSYEIWFLQKTRNKEKEQQPHQHVHTKVFETLKRLNESKLYSWLVSYLVNKFGVHANRKAFIFIYLYCYSFIEFIRQQIKLQQQQQQQQNWLLLFITCIPLYAYTQVQSNY
jgi:hypothetical protein